jgi:hypothetical protein
MTLEGVGKLLQMYLIHAPHLPSTWFVLSLIPRIRCDAYGDVGRLLRMYVSHAALIRPLNDRGKAKLNRDSAMFETAVSAIAKPSELGPAYQELRAFRELCFFGDEVGSDAF